MGLERKSTHNSPASNLTGVAVEIDGQDHWLSDIIIFSGLRGIVLHGGASVLTNTHIYNGTLVFPVCIRIRRRSIS